MQTKSVILCIVLLILYGCDNKLKDSDSSKISTELVHNPNTARHSYEKNRLPILHLEETVFDFGTINQGESVSCEFKIKNIGKGNLLISSAKGSCGCTVPQWPKHPIPIGGEDVLKVTFNSDGKQGKQMKTVTLVSNTIPNTKVITIKGTILAP